MAINTYLPKFELDILKAASELRKRQKFCDAILKTADGGVFKIHRVILAVTSPYFRALFAPRNVGAKRKFTIPGISAAMMNLLVNHAYSRLTEITEENVTELMAAAGQFLVDGVIKDCTAFLVERLDKENCIGFRNFAKFQFLFELEKEANKYLLKNFLQVSECEEFLELPPENLVALLSDDRLNVRNEEQVWEAGIRWMEHEPDERKAYAHKLLRCVRLGLLETSYFMEKVKNHPCVINNSDCRPIVIEALRFLWDLELISSRTEPVETPLLATPRIPHHVLFMIGGWTLGAPTDRIETYDTKADRWIQVNEVDPSGPRAYHKLGVIGHNIYVVGGFNGREYFSSCECFNAVTKQWTEVAPMNCKRCYVSVVMLDGHIYAMGGFDGNHRQNTAERYDPPRNQWTLVAPMNAQRSDAGATTQDGYIYIVGGFNGAECLNSAERYDPTTDTWTDITPMQQRRSGVSVISHHGNIYALGGFNGANRLANGERYDPATDQWSYIPDMSTPRSNFGVEVMDDMIFAMGGFNGTTTISHVECLDNRTNEWFEATYMHTQRSALAACVLFDLPNIDDYMHQNRRGLLEEKRQKLQQQRMMVENGHQNATTSSVDDL